MTEVLRINQKTDSVYCSRRSMLFASGVGFQDRALWEIAIAVSELVTNMIKFAGKGTITLRQVEQPRRGIEVIAEDQGPGIEDIETCATDGYSEGRSVCGYDFKEDRRGLGGGIGAVRRLMDSFKVEKRPDGGVRVVACKWVV